MSKNKKKKATLKRMWAMLQKDLMGKRVTGTSYNNNGLQIVVNFKDKIEWTLTNGILRRDGSSVSTISKTTVRSFEYQSLWGHYLIVRLQDNGTTSLCQMFKIW